MTNLSFWYIINQDFKNKNETMKNIRVKKVSPNTKQNDQTLMKKSLMMMLVIVFWVFSIGQQNIPFFWDILDLGQGLLTNKQLVANLDNIKDTSTSWPLKYTTNWSNSENYEKDKYTNFEDLPEERKLPFPLKLSDKIEKYKFVAPAKIWDNITNPLERQQVLHYKRLVTTLWTASYDCGSSNCKWWVWDSWTHAWVDFISSINTPIYSIANGIVLSKKTPCPGNGCVGFWNYLVIATVFDNEVVATFYAHMNSVNSNLKEGDLVKKWDLIWYLGKSWNASAPHLHLQINKLGSVDSIKTTDVAKKLFEGWFDTIQWIKETTYNPISFIEKRLQTVGDNFDVALEATSPPGVVEDKEVIESIEAMTGSSWQETDDSDKETDNETSQHSSADTPFTLASVASSKIDNRLLLWDSFTVTLKTSWKDGAISITTTNDVLSPAKYIISPNWETSYTFSVKANKVWNGQLIISDGNKKENLFYSVYDDTLDPVWISVVGDGTIYPSLISNYKVSLIDKLWNKVSRAIQGQMNVTLENKTSGVKKTMANVFVDNEFDPSFNVSSFGKGNYKLVVSIENNWKTYIVTKNLESNLFMDYPDSETYAASMASLYDKGIVKWTQWKLLPDNNISRAEVITVLIRNKYGDHPEDFTKQMQNYVKSKWKFFKDVSWQEWYAPYLYMAFKDGILKWASGKANAESAINKAELIAIYGRYFGVSRYDLFTNWQDTVASDWYKEYADAAKKYNLYPFDNYTNFKAEELVSRENAFESLYRYLNHDGFSQVGMVASPSTYSLPAAANWPTSSNTEVSDEEASHNHSLTEESSSSEGVNLESMVRGILEF